MYLQNSSLSSVVSTDQIVAHIANGVGVVDSRKLCKRSQELLQSETMDRYVRTIGTTLYL